MNVYFKEDELQKKINFTDKYKLKLPDTCRLSPVRLAALGRMPT